MTSLLEPKKRKVFCPWRVDRGVRRVGRFFNLRTEINQRSSLDCFGLCISQTSKSQRRKWDLYNKSLLPLIGATNLHVARQPVELCPLPVSHSAAVPSNSWGLAWLAISASCLCPLPPPPPPPTHSSHSTESKEDALKMAFGVRAVFFPLQPSAWQKKKKKSQTFTNSHRSHSDVFPHESRWQNERGGD